MDDRMKDALHQAYTGEAKAALRLKVFAKKAEEEGYPQVARLFRAVAFSEEVHGARALRLLREIRSTQENLEESFQSETGVAQVAYGEYLRLSYELGEKGVAWHFTQSRDVEEGHARLYRNALGNLIADRQTSYMVCPTCGWIAEGEPPGECPVCRTARDRFVAVS
jgi:rubrerythrin